MSLDYFYSQLSVFWKTQGKTQFWGGELSVIKEIF